MNTVVLIGRLTADPKLEKTRNDVDRCTFTLAVQRRGSKDEADFMPIVVWRGAARSCSQYLNKGSKVCVRGSLHINRYADENGDNKTYAIVNAEEVVFLQTKPATEQSNSTEPFNVNSLEEIDDSEMPF